MNSDMMVDENPMEDVGKTMPTDEFHDRFDEGRDPGLSFYRHESTQQFDLEEVIAQALPRDGSAMDRDTEREGMPLETVIPYDFDPMRDTIIVDIPRGYGAASGKTMEIKCHRFKPGAAVAIPVPKFTSDAARAGDLNAGPSTVSGSDSRASLSAAEPKQHAPSTSGGESGEIGGSSRADSTGADEDLAAKLAARTKSATRTTTVSQIYAKSFADPKAEDFKVEVTLTDEAGHLVAGGESENDDSGHGGTVSGDAAGGDGATSPRARGGKEGAWDPSVEGIWFTDKKVGADRSGDRGRGGETLPAKKKSMDEMQMGVPLDDLDVWTADSPAKKDRKKKKKKSLTWFFGNSSGWGLFGSGGNKKDLTEAAMEKMEQSGRVDGPASRRGSFDGQRRGSFDGNRRRSGEWQRPDPRSLRDHDSSGSSMKQNSGKSILSLSSGGSIESLKEMLAARQNSFGLVQRADSMTVPNGTGGRAFKVVACQGLTAQDDIWNALEHEDLLPETLPRRPDSPDQVPGPAQVDSGEVRQTRRSSLDSYSGDEASAGARELRVMPRSDYVRRNDRKDRKETSAGADGGSMRGRRRMARAVDKENVPGVVYLDDMPFAEGGFAKVYRGAFNNDGFSIAVAIKQMTYSLPEGETPDSLEFSRDDVTSHDERTPEARAKDRLRNMARTAAREVEIQQMVSHRMVVSHVMDHTGPSNDDPDATSHSRDANVDTSHLGPLTHWKTYIITEFCIGGSLRDILRQPNMVAATKQVRSSAAQLCIARQVVEGMKYLHSIGVVHNDLKASNVMLHPSGEMNCRWFAKIGDFGIARRMRPGQIRVPMDVMNGTVSHMAPELLQDKHMSKATDVYSFAVLLWEIAAQGESPFSGIDAVDVITAVVKHDLRPKFAENAFRPLIQLATRCWHADPHERPGFDEIGEELITWKPMVTFQRVENVSYRPIREAPESSGADGTTAEGIDDNTVTDASNASSDMPLSTGSVESLEAHARGLRIEERE
tara:strand:+ start:2422 stop:5412 length:2991 start_codon:yes stop_codon:yes gene_type:complete